MKTSIQDIYAVYSRDNQADARTTERPLLHSREEACRLLGVSLSTLKLLIGHGDLHEVRLGKRRLTPRTEIDRLIAERIASAGGVV
jgi:excisionase family DNA binding protein